MEGGGGRRRVSSRETSPDRARVSYTHHHHQQQQQQQQHHHQRSTTTTTTTATTRPLKKVQIVYYLSRNGQLEHPHFMEISHPHSQQLRLKDVLDKLTALRGKGMPSLFSWSCKRSYKNGYVWNDLCESDVIYPSDGAEYVLKGSEIITGCSERFQHPPVHNRGMIKPLSGAHKHYQAEDDDLEDEVGEIDDGEGLEDEYEDSRGARAASHGASARAKPYARGVSTEGIGRVDDPPRTRRPHHHRPMEVSFEDASPPSSSSSEKLPGAAAADSAGETGAGRNSVLLQLIACGAAAAAAKGRSGAPAGGNGARKSGGLQRWMVSRLAGRGAGDEDELRVGAARSGHRPAVEEKEYFSGSIVEGAAKGPPEPALKKSNSYNEERSSRLGIGEEGVQNGEEREEGEGAEGAVKRKCIPGIKMPSSSAKQQQQQQQQKQQQQQQQQLQFQPKKGSQ
ncbi:protein UPSTREAM OF FLC-like [Ananas comosus]|uniref:Protein UPSTREAM OF FLC-like n=1 Tax=Ananas comosus TaxID=4615 RepID=A0A6P5G6D8_ANACO|nr:protein UPSTREAM OF FLC-like [Ananas comosus]